MRPSTFTSALATAAAVTVTSAQSTFTQGKPAKEELPGKSPEGVTYNATIVSAAKSSINVNGFFALTSMSGEPTLDFQFRGVNKKNGGPFAYQIHEKAVSGNDCAAAGGVFNPYNSKVAVGAVGVDGGQFWPINVDSDVNTNGGFSDLLLSLDPKSKNFIGNRALVVSNGKGEPVACGTLKCVKGCEGQGNNGTSTSAPTSTPSATPSGAPKGNGTAGSNGTVNAPGAPGSGPALSTNSGAQLVASAGAMFMAFAAILL